MFCGDTPPASARPNQTSMAHPEQGECPHLRAQLSQAKQIAKLRRMISHLEMENLDHRMESQQYKRSVEYAIRHEDEQHDMVAARIDALRNSLGNVAYTLRGMAARLSHDDGDLESWAAKFSGELWEAGEKFDKLEKEELSSYHQWLSQRPQRLQNILFGGIDKTSFIGEESDDEIPELKESSDEASQ